MPSATTKSWLPAYPESWLLARIFPTCETAALLPVVAIQLPPKLERGRSNFDWSVQGHWGGCVDPIAVQERSVGGVEVLHHPVVAPEHQPGVVGGGVVVTNHQTTLAGSPDGQRLV